MSSIHVHQQRPAVMPPWPTRPSVMAGAPLGPPRGPGGTHPAAPPPPRPSRRDAELRGSSLGAAIRVGARAAVWMEEVDAGLRPVTHLRTVLDPVLAARWRQRPRRTRRAASLRSLGPVQVRRLGPTPTCSVVFLVDDGNRHRPIAMELQLRSGNWFVTELARPGLPDLPPLPPGWGLVLSTSNCRHAVPE